MKNLAISEARGNQRSKAAMARKSTVKIESRARGDDFLVSRSLKLVLGDAASCVVNFMFNLFSGEPSEAHERQFSTFSAP